VRSALHGDQILKDRRSDHAQRACSRRLREICKGKVNQQSPRPPVKQNELVSKTRPNLRVHDRKADLRLGRRIPLRVSDKSNRSSSDVSARQCQRQRGGPRKLTYRHRRTKKRTPSLTENMSSCTGGFANLSLRPPALPPGLRRHDPPVH
jgi:hypothetical protein